jgi:hypothetical protein
VEEVEAIGAAILPQMAAVEVAGDGRDLQAAAATLVAGEDSGERGEQVSEVEWTGSV